MTTNQTIDGVPRDLLAFLEKHVSGTCTRHALPRLEELRALLDSADHVHEWDINAEGTATVCRCGARSSDEPAAQSQAEPVAVKLPARDESLGTAENDMYVNGWRHGWNAYEHAMRQLGPLYAEQPAPVAQTCCGSRPCGCVIVAKP